jgi:hypothetical protein
MTHLDTPFFTNSEEQEPSHPEVITQLDTLTRSNLELPLSRHDLGIDTRDLYTRIQTSSLVHPLALVRHNLMRLVLT